MRRLLLTGALLLALLVALDRGALVLAERAVAERARTAGGLPVAPTVVIDGFPFLSQALRGSFASVRVAAAEVNADGVRLRQFSAQLRDAQVPLGQALGGHLTGVAVSGLTATAELTYADLDGARGVPAQLTVSSDGDGLVRVTGRLLVAGQPLVVSALSSVRLDGAAVVVTAQRFEVGGSAVSAVLAALLGGRLNLRIPVGALPYGLALTGVSVTPTGIEVSAQAGATVLH